MQETDGPEDLLELWFALTRRRWSTLVIVPAHPNGNVEELARGLASVGKSLSYYPVSVLNLRVVDPQSVRGLASIAGHLRLKDPVPTLQFEGAPELRALAAHEEEPARDRHGAGPRDRKRGAEPDADGAEDVIDLTTGKAPVGQLVISLPSVLTEPLGIAVARAADAVVLAVEMGRTRLADARKTLEAIGRENVIGTCVVRPSP